MPLQPLGFVSLLADGSTTLIRPTVEQAQQLVAEMNVRVRRGFVALPVFVDVPDAPPRPSVPLADGPRVVWRPGARVYRAAGVDYPTLVALIRALTVTDDEVDALQALPTQTAAWVTDGGRE
jgi:hypothetical protein